MRSDAANAVSSSAIAAAYQAVPFLLDPLTDGDDRPGGDGTQLDPQLVGVGVQQPAQRHHGRPGAVELVLQPTQVTGHELCPPLRVAAGDDRLDLGQRHVQLAQPVDHLRGGDLLAV